MKRRSSVKQDDFEEPEIESGKLLKTLEQYQQFYEDAVERYGPRTCVLMQVGSFYEVYGYDDPETGEPWNNAREMARAMVLQTSLKRKKDPMSKGNPLFAGTRCEHIGFRRDVLLEKGYVVVMVDQVTNDTKNPKREVTHVLTPGTQIQELRDDRSSNLVSLFVLNAAPRTRVIRVDRIPLIVGMVSIDLSTGESLVHTASWVPDYEAQALDETYRFLQAQAAKEVHIVGQGFHRLDEHQRSRFESMIREELNLDSFFVRNFLLFETSHSSASLEFQNELLNVVYPNHADAGFLSPIERIGLETQPECVSALVIALNAIYECRPNALKGLQRPETWEPNRHLVLEHNAIEQLSLAAKDRSRTASLVTVLDHTETSMGRRTLERWILNPLVRADDITQRHAAVGELVALGDGGIADLRKLLKTVSGDTTRLLRRAELGDLSPKKLGALYDGFRAMGQVFGWINAHAELDALKTWLPNSDTRSSIRSWIEEVDRTLDVDRLSAVSRISTTVTEPDELRIFRPGINVKVDEAFQQIDNAKRDLAQTSIALGELLYPTFPKNKVETKAKLTQNTSGAYYSVNNADVELLRWYCDQVRRLSARQKRRNKNQETPPSIRWWNSIAEWKEAMKRGDGELGKRIGERMLSNKSEEDESNSDEADDEKPNDFQAILQRGRNPNAKREEERVRVLSEAQIALISELRIANTRSKTKTHVNAARSDAAWEVINNAASNIRDAVDKAFRGFVSDIIGQHHDGLTRATHTLADIDALFSLARAALRYNYHRPEVDRDDDAEASFVEAKGIRHPIVERILENIEYVVNDVTLNENGLVLFGTNNSGKTTLGKATALNVVMAQCGGFVAAQSFRFRPFHNIITRLAGHDDMRTGRGTFAVEMTELRTILSRASPRSLVIGDELAHGTEHPSAIGLVASSIIELSICRTNFLFATHLHRLASLDCITELENVEFKHFHVDRDPDTDEIIYDRKLRSGSGPATYGIEVAAAQGIPQRVIERAHRIRRAVTDEAAELASNKRSRYNASVIMGKCQIPGCEAQAEETDHIKEQSTADERGVIDERFHKNEAHNLAPLCKKHHQDKTQGRLVIEGWATSTTEGRKLIVRYQVEGTVVEKRVSKDKESTSTNNTQSTLFSFW